MPTHTLLSKYNTTPGNVSQHVRFPDGVEHSARTLLLGISHLCPLYMTVDGKTYGGAGRSSACVRWEKGSAKRRASTASLGVTLVAGWNLQGDAVGYTGTGKVLRFLAQREGCTVRRTFTLQHPETTAAPHETNSVEQNHNKKWTWAHLNIACYLWLSVHSV